MHRCRTAGALPTHADTPTSFAAPILLRYFRNTFAITCTITFTTIFTITFAITFTIKSRLKSFDDDLSGILTRMNQTAPPLALYVHFPWCVKKCPYCDFNSHPQRGAIDQHAYIDALCADLADDLAQWRTPRRLTSVFLGGGTPSLFGGEAIGRLLTEVRAQFDGDAEWEVTLEANPGALEYDDFAAYVDAGVTRLSLGVQSFDDAQLKTLGRIHDSQQAARACGLAREANFAAINIDLMHALPNQTARAALDDLHRALDFAPRHLSMYQLTIEPHTEFHRRPPPLPSDARVTEMQTALHRCAAQHGYARYEVSAFARAAHQCRHNRNYWQFGDYLGIGAGAHGKITVDGVIHRYWKQKHPQRYLRAHAQSRLGGMRELRETEVAFEFALNALRLTEGVAIDVACAHTGHTAAELTRALAEPIALGLIAQDNTRIKCTPRGFALIDEILQMLLPAE